MVTVDYCFRYSSGGYSVWYYTEDVIHPDHHELIINSLTKSPNSTIKSEYYDRK